MRQERVPVPQEGLETYSPGWLPDGNTLVAMGLRAGAVPSLWLLSLDASRGEQLLQFPNLPAVASTYTVSPDGRRVLMQQREGSTIQLFALDLDTRQERC